jgi:hypothetical protein
VGSRQTRKRKREEKEGKAEKEGLTEHHLLRLWQEGSRYLTLPKESEGGQTGEGARGET